MIQIENVEVPDAEENETDASAEVKVRRVLEEGDKTKDQLVEATNLSETYLRNTVLPTMTKAKQIFVQGSRRPYTYTLTPPDSTTAPSAISYKDSANGALTEDESSQQGTTTFTGATT